MFSAMYPHKPLKQERKTWDSLSLASATRVITVETQTASHPASHDDQRTSSREHPNGYEDPFSLHDATKQVAYPFQPAIFLPQ